MVKLYGSILALTLATSSALASYPGYALDARDTLDDLEARHPLDLSSAFKIGSAIFKGAKVAKQGYGQAKEYRRKRQSQHRRHRRGLDADEELSQRDLDAEELFRREFGDFFVERDAFDHDLD